MEPIAKQLRGKANDTDNWADSYAGQRQETWLREMAKVMRAGADEIDSLKECYDDTLNPRR